MELHGASQEGHLQRHTEVCLGSPKLFNRFAHSAEPFWKQVYKYTGIQVYKYTSMQVYKYIGIRVYKKLAA